MIRTVAIAIAMFVGAFAQHDGSVPNGYGGKYKAGISEVGNALASNVHDVETLGDSYKWVKCYNMGKLYIPGTAKVEMCDGGSPFSVPDGGSWGIDGYDAKDSYQSSIAPPPYLQSTFNSAVIGMKARFNGIMPQYDQKTGAAMMYVPTCLLSTTSTGGAPVLTPTACTTNSAATFVATYLPLINTPAGLTSYSPTQFYATPNQALWGTPVWLTEQGGYVLNHQQIKLLYSRLQKNPKVAPWCAEVKGECGRETNEGMALGFYSAQRGCEAYCAGNDDIEWRYGSTFDSARVTNVEYLVGGMPNAPADDKMHQCTCIAKFHEPHSSRTVVEFHDRYFNAEYYAVPIREFTNMRDMRPLSDTGSAPHGALFPDMSKTMYTA